MNRFSDGPWVAQAVPIINNGFNDQYIRVVGEHGLICKVMDVETARLIASAPDLYKSLVQARAMIQAYMKEMNSLLPQEQRIDPDFHLKRFDDIIHQARPQ